MPQYPQGDERDRFIAPVSDDEMGDDSDNDAQQGNLALDGVDIAENDDGSADVTFGDEQPGLATDFDTNLAEHLDQDVLEVLGRDLCDLVTKDKEAREKRDKQYEEGIRRSGLGDDAPGGANFSGASRVVHPMLAECCVDFAARAIKELFPPSGPVRTALWGQEDERKLDVANRKARFMNWQLTKQIREYRSELEQMLTQLPMGGSQYQKFWYDARLKRNRTEFVPIDDVFLPYACRDFYTAHRKTHVLHLTQQEFEQRVYSNLYLDVATSQLTASLPEMSASASASEKVEGKEPDAYNEDGVRDVYEVYMYSEFEQDDASQGELAPYIVTVDAYTEKVLAVYRNWEQSDPGMQALDWMVEWKFIPWRGAYAIGFPHLIGGLSGAATGSLRALLDSAHINNTATLVKLRGGKMSGQNLEVEPTQIAEIEGPAGTDDIRKVMMAMPYNPPSPTLFQLLGWLTDAGKGVIATAEEAIQNVGDRTPVGTTMAMIEQGSHTYSAIHARLHYSQAKALEILQRLNKTYMDDQEQVHDLGNLVISRDEFRQTDDIQPVSDPNIFAESQRFAQMQGAAQVLQLFPQEKWNVNALARGMLERLRIPNVDELLPKPPAPKNMNPAAENIAAMHGAPIIALPQQNHIAHIYCHIEFCLNPVFANPIMGAKLMPTMLRHIGEHIGFYYTELMAQVTHFDEVVGQMPTKQMEDTMARANDAVLTKLQNDLGQAMANLQKIAQMAQQFAPQPPMDPAVKATYDVGMAEVNRKSQRDKQELSIQEQEKLQLLPTLERDKHRNDLLKNAQDNKQKHFTELLKNNGDNQTNRWVAALQAKNELILGKQQQVLDKTEAMANTTDDGTELPEGTDVAAPEPSEIDQAIGQHQSAMDADQLQLQNPNYDAEEEVNTEQFNALNQQNQQLAQKVDQLTQVMTQLAQLVGAPKQVLRGMDGKITGIQVMHPAANKQAPQQ